MSATLSKLPPRSRQYKTPQGCEVLEVLGWNENKRERQHFITCWCEKSIFEKREQRK
jgi:hypothetical protein